MSIKNIGQNTVKAFIETIEKFSVTETTMQETTQPFVATEGKRGDEQFYGEMRRSAIENKLNVKSRTSAANSFVLEPTKKQAGTVEDFIKVMNESPSKVGQQKGQDAQNALLRLGETEGWLGTEPKNTPYFNLKPGRYIYTKKGGWIDMVHSSSMPAQRLNTSKTDAKIRLETRCKMGIFKKDLTQRTHLTATKICRLTSSEQILPLIILIQTAT